MISYAEHMYTPRSMRESNDYMALINDLQWKKCKGTLKTVLDLTDPIEVGSNCHVGYGDILVLKESHQTMTW